MQTITTFLTFNDQAEEAVHFYTGIFSNSTITRMTRYGAAGPMPAGTVMSATFRLNGQEFIALNGGSYFKFSEGISLFVTCETQQEVDDYWEKLSVGGEKGQCGWLKDKFGVSWQIVPRQLDELMQGNDRAKGQRVMAALMKMTKIEISELENA